MPELPTTLVNASGSVACGMCISHHESCVNGQCKCNDGFIRNNNTCIGKMFSGFIHCTKNEEILNAKFYFLCSDC